jgi:hypothetical protein
MIDQPPICCLLWDFGDTLCNERFIWDSGPEWMEVYKTFDDGWADAWNTGEMDFQEFADKASRTISLPPAEIIKHMVERCRHIEFFEFTYGFYKARHLPQAIVTVNPDLWTEAIVPLHQFDETADVIVSSWEEGTVDKRILCQLALDRLEINCEPGQSVLIDNKASNVQAWKKCGGHGYMFTTDAQFRLDVSGGIDALVRKERA